MAILENWTNRVDRQRLAAGTGRSKMTQMHDAAALLQAAKLTPMDFIRSLLIAAGAFVVLGTVSALWTNPFFVRMTPTSGFETVLLAAQSVLLGLYFGSRSAACARKKAGVGGVLGYLGVACPVCNKILLLIFGSGVLLTYFEPIRLYVGLAGLLLLTLAVWQKTFAQIAPATEPDKVSDVLG